MVQDILVDAGDAHAPATSGTDARQACTGVAWARDSILFSSCNEDSGSELSAFGELEGKRILSITAGGGRVLNLLVGRPELICAVDLNPVQNYLLELKAAGMRALEHAQYLEFLGVRESSERLAVYSRIRAQLSAGAQSFFDAHPGLIDSGILFEGRLERYLRKISKLLQWAQPLGLRRLFECEDIEQQRKWLRKLDSAPFRALAQSCCRRSVLQAFSGDPGFYRYIPSEIPLHRVIYGGVIEHFTHHLARNNPLMQLVFFGRFIHEAALPAYLNAATYERVRDALRRVRLVIRTATVNEVLSAAGAATFDAFSLSDISSYLDDTAHDQLFEDTLAAAREGAIVCSRSNIHHRPLRREHEARLTRNTALERRLAIADHSCVHKFVIGQVG
jgi:S-adenosylmethionine-diacylglycerol 3-amino-3-carboxypropyl transferase